MNSNYDSVNIEIESNRLFSQNIVKAICKKVFSTDRALCCLLKSDSFFKELLNIFCRLDYFEISPEKFADIIKNNDFSDTDKKRLDLFFEVYKTFVLLSEKNGYKIPLHRAVLFKNFSDDIAKNIENKKYLEFSDIQNESIYIVSKIKESVALGNAFYSDFAIFADKFEARQKFLDLLVAEKIPVTSSIYNENYENLKHKINIYQKISEILLDLKIEKFSLQDIKDYNASFVGISKSQKEICFDSLDEIFKSLFVEILSDSYCLDKILTKNENSKQSLLEIVYSHITSFDDQDKEILNVEFSLIKNFYEYYKANDYAKAISCVIRNFLHYFENTNLHEEVLGKIKSLSDLQSLYDNVVNEKPDFDSFKEILQWLSKDSAKEKNSVRLGSITSELKKDETFKYVFVSGLTENNFPGTNNAYPFISFQTNEKLVEKIREINPNFDYFIKTDEVHFRLQLQSLQNICKHAAVSLIFTTHSYEAKKTVIPSVFFKNLAQKDKENYQKINDINDKNKTFEYTKSLELKKDELSNVIKNTDVLKLNPSAISAFQQCPRKYYYKNLLNLKESSTFAASYGSIVHAAFEVMNRQFIASYSKSTAIQLSEILFDSKNNENKALDIGFSQTDVELIKATDELSLQEMKNNFKNAIEDYDKTGSFDEPPQKAVCEKTFSFSLPELPNVIFDGRIDAILSYSDGRNVVVDYKTGKNKVNSLDYAISEYGVNFKSKSGKEPANIATLQNNYDYQIPLYYLACQNSDDLKEYKDKITHLGLIYVRPQSRYDGCDEDFVSAEKIDLYKDKIIQNLKETVIDKIVNETEFECVKNWNCENCSFKYLCDGEGDNDD